MAGAQASMQSNRTISTGLQMSCLFVLACVISSSGCSMCCGPFDYHYPAFPGIVHRSDPIYGRVGSILSDPYTAGSGPSADSNLKRGEREDTNREQPPEILPSPQPDVDSPQAPKGDGTTNVDRETENQWYHRDRTRQRGQWR